VNLRSAVIKRRRCSREIRFLSSEKCVVVGYLEKSRVCSLVMRVLFFIHHDSGVEAKLQKCGTAHLSVVSHHHDFCCSACVST